MKAAMSELQTLLTPKIRCGVVEKIIGRWAFVNTQAFPFSAGVRIGSKVFIFNGMAHTVPTETATFWGET